MVLPQITTHLLTSLPNHTIHTEKKKNKNLNTNNYIQTLKSYCYQKGLLPVTANVFILTHRVAAFWLIPGGSVGLIPVAAVLLLVIHVTEMEGGQEESMVTSHLLRGDLFQVV